MSRSQLARLLDLPDDTLQQVLDYGATLSKADAVDHFKNLLGDAPAAISFISDFNARRHDPAAPSVAAAASGANSASSSAHDGVPKPQRAQKKKKAPLHTPAPRQIASVAPVPGAVYNKKSIESDYIAGRPLATALPPKSATPPPPPKKQPASAGSLIQDALRHKGDGSSKGSKASGSTTAPSNAKSGKSAHAKTKINITGGTAMHGASTALADFDAAIRALEISTNPALAGSNDAARRCACVATRHPLQTAAPNCLQCGKVVCVKEGLGPCTFCGAPLLSADDVQAMIKELRTARGRERMAADAQAHRREGPGGSKKPAMVAGTVRWGGDDDFVSLAEAEARRTDAHAQAEAAARAHRDKLLAFQAENAQRTTVRDEAADFDVGDAMAAASGQGHAGSMWARPEERAKALKKQQKLLRELEWNARPEYEKRQQVVSIDITGRKVFRKTVAVEHPATPESASDDDFGAAAPSMAGVEGTSSTGGTFSRNPLLGGLIKPVYVAKPRRKQGKGKGKKKNGADDSEDDEQPLRGRKDDPAAATRWRRVQDDLDDNEAVVLDGGLYGTAGSVGGGGAEPERG